MKNLTHALVLAVALTAIVASAASADVRTTTGTISYLEGHGISRALSNYKNTPVELQLLDRLPHTNDASIKIELVKTEPELSTESEYLRTAKKKGILRWDLELSPNTVEKDATIVTYSFTMEYDRNMQIQPRRPGRTQ